MINLSKIALSLMVISAGFTTTAFATNATAIPTDETQTAPAKKTSMHSAIHRSAPITLDQASGLHCFYYKEKQTCAKTKEQFLQDASYAQHREILTLKRQHQNNELNKVIVQAFVDNHLTVLEYHYIKHQADELKALRNK